MMGIAIADGALGLVLVGAALKSGGCIPNGLNSCSQAEHDKKNASLTWALIAGTVLQNERIDCGPGPKNATITFGVSNILSNRKFTCMSRLIIIL